jgi:hypothetical protein
MNIRIIKSTITLAVVIALGAGVTYAQLTSNQVSIGTSAMTSGESSLKLCNDTGDDLWKLTISPALSLAGMVPGETERELTEGKDIYAGNDSGVLDVNTLSPVGCNGYGDTAGSSDVNMRLVPSVDTVVCTGGIAETDMTLSFQIGSTGSNQADLGFWDTNTTAFGDTLTPDELKEIRIFGKLNSSVTQQNASCTFDVKFSGEQI